MIITMLVIVFRIRCHVMMLESPIEHLELIHATKLLLHVRDPSYIHVFKFWHGWHHQSCCLGTVSLALLVPTPFVDLGFTQACLAGYF
jgi:hypothetical protein